MSVYIYFDNLRKFLFKGILSFFGSFNDLELINNVTAFFNLIGTEVFIPNVMSTNFDFRINYLINQLVNIFENLKIIMFVGINIRLELPLMNAKLRKLMLIYGKRIKLYNIGLSNSYNNIPLFNVGNSIEEFFKMLKGKSKVNLDILNTTVLSGLPNTINLKYKNFKIFFGSMAYNLVKDARFYIEKMMNNYYFFSINIIYPNISMYNIAEYNNIRRDNIYNFLRDRFIFLENVDDQHFLNSLNIKENDFVVYHGHFVGGFSKFANLLIPSTSIYESNASYINLEGRTRKLTKAISQNLISSSDYLTVLKICFTNYIKTNFSLITNFRKIVNFFEFLNLD
jgi:hypothetical protein